MIHTNDVPLSRLLIAVGVVAVQIRLQQIAAAADALCRALASDTARKDGDSQMPIPPRSRAR